MKRYVSAPLVARTCNVSVERVRYWKRVGVLPTVKSIRGRREIPYLSFCIWYLDQQIMIAERNGHW